MVGRDNEDLRVSPSVLLGIQVKSGEGANNTKRGKELGERGYINSSG